jgi:hypothetical protein
MLNALVPVQVCLSTLNLNGPMILLDNRAQRLIRIDASAHHFPNLCLQAHS